MSTTNNESSARNKVQALLAEAIAIVEKMSSEEREAFQTSKTIRGEPIDVCERLDKDGFAVEVVAEGLEADGHEEFSVALRETAALEREAAAEIRRLRAESESRYRAGIEAAVRVECSCCRDGVPLHRFFKNMHVLPDGTERGCVAYRIRDLADKPPANPREGG